MRIDTRSYAKIALPHLEKLVQANAAALEKARAQVVSTVIGGGSLFVFGSGHSSLFALELYHRAGGASFVVPIVAEHLMPQAGPPIVRVLERTGGLSKPLLARSGAKTGDLLWIASQSGINHASVEMALEAQNAGIPTVAFTSRVHSQAVSPRHPSGKRLFEVCGATLDLGGVVGDAAVPIGDSIQAGPLSTLGATLLGHSILVAACAELERMGIRCTYVSVNTPDGESRNQEIEKHAAIRDPLLRSHPSKD